MKKIIKNKRCRSCKKQNLKRVLKYENSPIGDDYRKYPHIHEKFPIELYLCKSCGLSQLLHVINPNILYSKYIYKTEDSPGLVKHFKNFATNVTKKLNLKKNSKILDIGSNDGVLLKEFKKKSHIVCGIEPAKKISDEANKKNIKTYNDFLNQKLSKKILTKEGQFDLIVSNNVFANVDNINQWAEDIKILLKKSGSYVFETYYLYKLLKNKVFDFIYHEHLTSFSVKPLCKFFETHNLVLYDVDLISTKGGSIRCYVAHKGKRKVTKNVKYFVKKENDYGIFKEKRFITFQKEINLLANKTYNFLSKSKLSSKDKKKEIKIIGYGASISCTTLLYHYKIKNFLDYIVDDNKVKLNRYLPGSNIKVERSKKLFKTKPDLVLILAWRFSKMIIKNLKKLKGKTRIKVIIPCPKFKVIKL